jgi:hypothetical protein
LLKDYEKEAKKFSSVPWSFKDGAIKYCLNDSILLRKVVNSPSLTAVTAVIAGTAVLFSNNSKLILLSIQLFLH